MFVNPTVGALFLGSHSFPLQLSPSSTSSTRHWHTSNRLTSLILIITLTHPVMPPDFYFTFKYAQQKPLDSLCVSASEEQTCLTPNSPFLSSNILCFWNTCLYSKQRLDYWQPAFVHLLSRSFIFIVNVPLMFLINEKLELKSVQPATGVFTGNLFSRAQCPNFYLSY